MTTNTNQSSATGPSIPERLAMPLTALLALLSASCCVLPIGLSIIGLGGSWLTILSPFIAYRSPILAVVALALVWAWFRVLRPNPCETRKRSPILWAAIATCAFLIALSSPLWEGSAQTFMWDLWRSTR